MNELASLSIAPGNKRQERCNAKVEAVGDGESDEKYAEQQPPNQSKGFIIDGDAHGADSMLDCDCARR